MKTHLIEFIDALRQAGLSISTAETLDAARAVGTLGIERHFLREALAATLVKDQADRPEFDAAFDRFFALPGRSRAKGKRAHPSGDTAGEGVGKPGPAMGRSPSMEPRPLAPVPRRPSEAQRQEHESKRDHAESGQTGLQTRVLRRTPFNELSALQIEACEQLVADLAQRFRAHLSRHLRAERSGRLDVRRTLRRSITYGGVPIEPRFRQRRPGRPDLVALCDYSHSVVTATNFLMALLAPAQEFFRRVRLFGFVDLPVEVSIEDGRLVPHERLDLYARSDFGRVLVEFWNRHEPVFTRNTILLILGDARNNRRPPRADVLGRMRSVVRQVVWLNPDPIGRWNTGDSVIRAYQPSCDTVIAASNVMELNAALRRIVRI